MRTPEEQTGDLMAQIASNVIAQRRIQELADRYGKDNLRGYFGALLDYSERRMVAGIRSLPEGVYRGEDVIEGDGIVETDVTKKPSARESGEISRRSLRGWGV